MDISSIVNLFQQRTNRIFATVELDINTLFILYDKNGSDTGVYAREINVTNIATPLIGEEQQVWSGTWATFSGNASNSLASIPDPLMKLSSTQLAYFFIAGSSVYTNRYLKLTKSAGTWTGTLVIVAVANSYTSSTFYSIRSSCGLCVIDSDRFIFTVNYSTTTYIHECNVTTGVTTNRLSSNYSTLSSPTYPFSKWYSLGNGKYLWVFKGSTYISARVLTVSGTTYTMGAINTSTVNNSGGAVALYQNLSGTITYNINGNFELPMTVSDNTVTFGSTNSMTLPVGASTASGVYEVDSNNRLIAWGGSPGGLLGYNISSNLVLSFKESYIYQDYIEYQKQANLRTGLNTPLCIVKYQDINSNWQVGYKYLLSTTPSNPSFNSTSAVSATYPVGSSDYKSISSVAIDSTRSLIAWNTGTNNKWRVCVATHNGTSVSYGSTIALYAGDGEYVANSGNISKLSDSVYLWTYRQIYSNYYDVAYAVSITLSGSNTITAGTFASYTFNTTPGYGYDSKPDWAIKNGTTTRYSFRFTQQINTGSGYDWRCHNLLSYTGSTLANAFTSSYSTNDTTSDAMYSTLTVLDKDGSSSTCRILVTYKQSNAIKAQIFTYTWATNGVTETAPVTIVASDPSTSAQHCISLLSTDKLLLTYPNSTNISAKVLTINNTTITANTVFTSTLATTGTILYHDSKAISETTALVLYVGNTKLYSYMLNIDGTAITGPTSIQIIDSTVSGANPEACVSSGNYIALIYKNSDNYPGYTFASISQPVIKDVTSSTTLDISSELDSSYINPISVDSSTTLDISCELDSSYEEAQEHHDATSSALLDVSGNIESNYQSNYSINSSTELDLSQSIESGTQIDYEISSSTSISLSGEEVSNFTKNLVSTTSSTSFSFSNHLTSTKTQNPPYLLDFTTLLQQRSKYIYYSCYVDDVTLLIVYDKYDESGANIYCREITYNDMANPVIGSEQTLFTNQYTRYARNPAWPSYNDIWAGRVEDGLLKLSDSSYMLLSIVRFAELSNSYYLKGYWISKSGSTYTGSYFNAEENFGSSHPTPTAFTIDSIHFGLISSSSCQIYSVQTKSSYYPDLITLEVITSGSSVRVTPFGSNNWIVSSIDSSNSYPTICHINISSSDYTATQYVHNSVYTSSRRAQPLRAIYTGNYIYFFYTSYVSGSSFSFNCKKFDKSWNLIDTKTIYSYSGSSASYYNTEMTGGISYSDNLLAINLHLTGYTINSYNDGIFLYNFSGNSISIISGGETLREYYDQDLYKVLNGNIIGLYGLRDDSTSNLNTISIGINYSYFSTVSDTPLFITSHADTSVAKRYFNATSSTTLTLSDIINSIVGGKNYSTLSSTVLNASGNLLSTYGYRFDVDSSTSLIINGEEISEYYKFYSTISSTSISVNGEEISEIGGKNYIIDSLTSIIISSSLESNYTRNEVENFINYIELDNELNSSTQEAWTTNVESIITIDSNVESTYTKDEEISSDTSINIEMNQDSNSISYFKINSSTESEYTGSIVSDFIRKYIENSSNMITLIGDFNSVYQDFQKFHSEMFGSMTIDSDMIYDFIRTWSSIASDTINIDAVAESIWTSIQNNSLSGELDLLADIDAWKREFRFEWSADVSGTSFITSTINSNTDAITQQVFLYMPIDLDEQLDLSITLEEEKTMKITTETTLNLQLLNQYLEEK